MNARAVIGEVWINVEIDAAGLAVAAVKSGVSAGGWRNSEIYWEMGAGEILKSN